MSNEKESSPNVEQSKIYGMRLENLTDEILDEIVNIYYEVVGRSGNNLDWNRYPAQDKSVEYVKQMLRGGRNAVEWRLGSTITPEAKFFIWEMGRSVDGKDTIRFSFDPNIVEGSEADRLKESFKQRVKDYLLSKGLMVEK